MEHNEFADDIMKINPQIRFVGIYRKGDYFTKVRAGIDTLLSDEETKESMRQAVMWMRSHNMHAQKIGRTHYSLAKYDKITRITIPFGRDGLILITTESEAEHDPIGEKVLELSNTFEESLF